LAGPRRSSRAINDACKLAGTARVGLVASRLEVFSGDGSATAGLSFGSTAQSLACKKGAAAFASSRRRAMDRALNAKESPRASRRPLRLLRVKCAFAYSGERRHVTHSKISRPGYRSGSCSKRLDAVKEPRSVLDADASDSQHRKLPHVTLQGEPPSKD
jgi:hypothetical protein